MTKAARRPPSWFSVDAVSGQSEGPAKLASVGLSRATCAAHFQRRFAAAAQAAFSHIAVSNALLIIGMFMPKLALAALLAAGLAGFSATLWVVSVARSHDPCSWERATEKNRST